MRFRLAGWNYGQGGRMMRGKVDRQGEVFHAFLLDDLVPAGHPLRAIKARADRVLGKMSRRFNQAYADKGRPGVPPERLSKALLLQSLYSIRSEIQPLGVVPPLCEQIGYNMLYRWFLDMNPSEKAWTPEVFSMNRRRFADHGLGRSRTGPITDWADHGLGRSRTGQ
jgi:transposase